MPVCTCAHYHTCINSVSHLCFNISETLYNANRANERKGYLSVLEIGFKIFCPTKKCRVRHVFMAVKLLKRGNYRNVLHNNVEIFMG